MIDERRLRERDGLNRFLLERSGVRGVLVRLDDTWREIAGKARCPDAVARLLGECCVASALFTAHAKVDRRLGVQIRGDGPVRTLFAECTAQGRVRGLAHWNDPVPAQLGPAELGANAVLAITIENERPGQSEMQRYQGLVALEGERLSQAFEGYFAQSEQLPTRVALAADERSAVGLMLQLMPGQASDEDGWARAQALFDTLTDDELRDIDPQTLLYRLFHEEGVRALAAVPLRFGCSCSRERVASMLVAIGREEAFAAAQVGDGIAEIACEFCAATYRFDRVDLEQLFTDTPAAAAPSTRQ